MKRKRFSEAQIIGVLQAAETGIKKDCLGVNDLFRWRVLWPLIRRTLILIVLNASLKHLESSSKNSPALPLSPFHYILTLRNMRDISMNSILPVEKRLRLTNGRNHLNHLLELGRSLRHLLKPLTLRRVNPKVYLGGGRIKEMIDYKSIEKQRGNPKLEGCLYALYHREVQNERSFAELVGIFGKAYPLIAYLFFLKDKSRYLPIAPQRFDYACERLEVNFKTSRLPSWENYQSYLSLIRELKTMLAKKLDVRVTLLEAHSFASILGIQMDPEPLSSKSGATAKNPDLQDGQLSGLR